MLWDNNEKNGVIRTHLSLFFFFLLGMWRLFFYCLEYNIIVLEAWTTLQLQCFHIALVAFSLLKVFHFVFSRAKGYCSLVHQVLGKRCLQKLLQQRQVQTLSTYQCQTLLPRYLCESK